MREVSHCLNALLALLAIPMCLCVLLAALVGMISTVFSFSLDWLPAWLQFISTQAFFMAAFGLMVWYSLVASLSVQRTGADMAWWDTMIGDGLAGYLLWAGLAVAAVVLWQVLF
ncbi:MAG: hypothetical protein Fur0043_23470 [Anaerolineales bacterium]